MDDFQLGRVLACQEEIEDLKKVIATLQADNARLERERDNYLRQIKGECPNCGSPNWDKVTGCDVCSLGPEDLT